MARIPRLDTDAETDLLFRISEEQKKIPSEEHPKFFHTDRLCPYCGKGDGHCERSSASDMPDPGSFGLCINCTEVSIWGADMRLRHPTEQEVEKLNTTHTGHMALAHGEALVASSKRVDAAIAESEAA